MPHPIKNILWATDFSREAHVALLYADLFAKTFSAGITALHAAPDFAAELYGKSHPIRNELDRRTEALKKKARVKVESAGRGLGIAFKRTIVVEGSPAKKIVETAEEEKADLIVMGRKGESGLEKILIGSVANHVLRHSPVPVLATKKMRTTLAVRKILVPTDFTKGEDVEREFAWQLAKAFGASLTFLYVLELYGQKFALADQMFESVLEKFERQARHLGKGVKVDHVVTRGVNAALGIDSYSRAHRFDLIVMATCTGGLSRFLLGSNTEKVISYSDLPVLALPPKYCA